MNVDFVPFIRGVCVLCKPRLVFSRINGPNVNPTSSQSQNYFLVLSDVSHVFIPEKQVQQELSICTSISTGHIPWEK